MHCECGVWSSPPWPQPLLRSETSLEAGTLCTLAASDPERLECSPVAPAPAGTPRTAREVKLWGLAMGGALRTIAVAQCMGKGDGCPGLGMWADLGVGPVIRPCQQHGTGPDKAAEIVHVVIRGPVLMHPLHNSAICLRCLVPVRPGDPPVGQFWTPHQQAMPTRMLVALYYCMPGQVSDSSQRAFAESAELSSPWHKLATSHMTVSSCKSCVACCSLYHAMRGSDSHASPWAAKGPS